MNYECRKADKVSVNLRDSFQLLPSNLNYNSFMMLKYAVEG